MDQDMSSSHGEDEAPFFADMTLDLAVAHDIAETPEPTTRKVVGRSEGSLDSFPRMPDIPQEAPLAFSEPDTSNDNPDFGRNNLNSIRSVQAQRKAFSRTDSGGGMPSSRRWPRDSSWALAFGIFIPVSLLGPIILAKKVTPVTENKAAHWIATAMAPRLATLHSLGWAAVAAFILCRLLYRTMGGGDGDDARHIASQIILAAAPISASVYFSLILVIHFLLPHAWPFMILPLWSLARDLFLFRQWKMTSSTPGGRQAFFQALTCMTLDILSRSLRRASFFRVVSALLLVQLVVIAWWRMALLAALRSQSIFWFLMAATGGKWATGTVARLLSLIASGGICSWFAEQDSMVAEMQQMRIDRGDATEETIDFMGSSDTKSEDGDDSLPEEYRTSAASAYQTTIVLDEGMDDDFEDEPQGHEASMQPLGSFLPAGGSTVKQLLIKGLTLSFGSVCKCGLLGGFAQFIWSQLRKIDVARARLGGFQGMSIGSGNGTDENYHFKQYFTKSGQLAREFVRNHSDMAMSHVAAFQKSYQRAAQDVALLIDESGVEQIIHDDISTHISACVGGTIAGAIVIFTGSVLVHQRNRSYPNVSDSAVIFDMILAIVFCYTLIFTVMEPLRASIKAVYVSFAQHPQSISQSFPLIFHRLSHCWKLYSIPGKTDSQGDYDRAFGWILQPYLSSPKYFPKVTKTQRNPKTLISSHHHPNLPRSRCATRYGASNLK
eukprot:scaffold7344_cov145-Cylindrotheca_fusiformis.AAC.7